MKIFRIKLIGWTASFRYPAFISGFQPTLPVPPLSTIYGLLSAAKGTNVLPQDVSVGYVFKSQGKAVDLETIYELVENLRAKSNIVRREILFQPELYLYISGMNIAEYFDRPFYPLLLGRSTELAMVDDIKEIELEERNDVKFGGTICPFPTDGIYGPIQALPTHFTDEIPRKAVGTKPFYLLEDFLPYNKKILADPENQWGVWLYNG